MSLVSVVSDHPSLEPGRVSCFTPTDDDDAYSDKKSSELVIEK